MYRNVILTFAIILAIVGISAPALGQSNFSLSGIVDVRGMIPIGSGKVPYARFVLEQVGIYGVDDPTHLHLNLIGADFPILHKPVGPLLGIELSGFFGPLWELKTWTLNFRQFLTFGLRRDPAAVFGHFLLIGNEFLVFAPSGVAGATIWGAAVINLYNGLLYGGIRASGDVVIPGSGKAGPSILINYDFCKRLCGLLFLLSYERGIDNGDSFTLIAYIRFGKTDNYVEPAVAQTPNLQLGGPAPGGLLPGQVEVLARAESAARGAEVAATKAAADAARATAATEVISGKLQTGIDALGPRLGALEASLEGLKRSMEALTSPAPAAAKVRRRK